jgi:tripartite-type tricarboxylate transporter receptor subunit TctC
MIAVSMHRPLALASACLSLALATAPAPAAAATWPDHPVRIIVATPPGQAVDILGRLFAEAFARAFKQSFIVENKAGAGGMIGTNYVARAAPDGYTLMVASSGPLVVTPAINPKTPYDPVADFAPIGNIALTPQMLLVGASSPFKTVADVVAAAHARPGRLNFSSTGIGSTSHLAMERFRAAADIQLNHIPFKGNQDAFAQLIAGDVAVGFDTVPGALTVVKSGMLRALAVAAPQRSPFLPDVPTFAEAGYPSVQAIGWVGLAAPAGTPPDIVARLNEQLRAAMATPAMKERFATLAFVPADDTPQSFGDFIKSERKIWADVAHKAGVQVE